MIVLRPAVSVFAWCAYSVLQRVAVHRGTFASMRLLSETRVPDGDKSKLSSFGRKAKSVPDDWVFLAGDKEASKDCIRKTKDLACCYNEQGTSFALFGRTEPPKLSMRQLVARRTLEALIEENIYDRVNWQRNIDACVSAADSEFGISKLDGVYRFCFRDYVNQEEMSAMLIRRWCIERLLFYVPEVSKLVIEKESKKCEISEKCLGLGLLPIQLSWEGDLVDDTIKWYTSSVRLGWAKFGKTFDKPSAAEKLRVDPWKVFFPKEEENDDIVVFHRLGCGKLVFAKEKLLAAK